MTVQTPLVAEYMKLRHADWSPTEAWHHVLSSQALQVAEDTGAITFEWQDDDYPDLSWLDQPGFEDEKAEVMRRLGSGNWTVGVVVAWGRMHACEACGEIHRANLGAVGGVIGAPGDVQFRETEINLALEAGVIGLPGKRKG